MQVDAEKNPQTGAAPVTEIDRKGARLSKQYWVMAIKAMITYLIIIWIPACYILGSTYEQKHHVKNMKMIIVDFDQSGIGKSISGTCAAASATENMPTFQERTDITNYDDAYDEVWSGRYWGGVVVHQNATQHFLEAFMKGDTSYDPKSAVSVIYNSARWPAVTFSFVKPVLPTLVEKAEGVFQDKFGTQLLEKINGTITPEMYRIFYKPFEAANDDIHPFNIGARYFLGTATIVFPTIVTFFVSLGTRGASQEFGHLRPIDGLIYRGVVGLVLTFIGGFFFPLWFTMFHEDAPLSVKGFFVAWMVFWLYSQACFWFFDTAANMIPLAFLPPTCLTFIIIQVAATVFPLDIKNRFYKIEYIWPSFNAFELFISVVSHGSSCHAKRNVPVLFAWIIFWICVNVACHKHILNKDIKAKEENQRSESEDYASDVTAGR